MERPRPASPAELNAVFAEMRNEKDDDNQTASLFNIRIDRPLLDIGYGPQHELLTHFAIPFPQVKATFEEITPESTLFRGMMDTDKDDPYISLIPDIGANGKSSVRMFKNKGRSFMPMIFANFVCLARLLAESGLPHAATFTNTTINILDEMNHCTNGSLFEGSIRDLGELAAIELPSDVPAANVLPFPIPIAFEHRENHPDRNCSFGFNIVHPEKFPYNAQAVAKAVRDFIGSYGWDPLSLDMVLKPITLPSKDGERVIHITSRNISKERTELTFCIRKPLEYEANAPVTGQIVFRR